MLQRLAVSNAGKTRFRPVLGPKPLARSLAAGGQGLQSHAEVGSQGSEGHDLLGMAVLFQGGALTAQLLQ